MLLYNHKVSISANKLKELLKVKGIEFDLPITKDNLKNFYGLVGISSHSGFAGVYVFTHKAYKSMYVGSSTLRVDVVWSIILKISLAKHVFLPCTSYPCPGRQGKLHFLRRVQARAKRR
jgi:hypothetical protein